MPDSSLFLEFDTANPVAIAKLWPSWTSLYPALLAGRWYRVLDVGQDEHGMFIDAHHRPRYVARAHFQLAPMPGRPLDDTTTRTSI